MSDTSMSDAISQGSSTSGGLKEAAGQTFQEMKSRTKEAMPRITESVRGQAMEQAETAKDTLASTAERLARSLRESNSGDDSVQAKLMLAAADAVTNLSDQLRGRNLDELWGDVQGFARRNPGAFVAAAAVAGFALARFARTSSRGSQSSQYGSYGAMGGYGSGTSGSYGSDLGGAAMGSPGMGSSGMGSGGSSAGSSSGSGMGSGGAFAGAGSLGVGTGSGYGSGMGGSASTAGMGATGDVPGSIADDGMGGGTASGSAGSGTSNSTSDTSGSGYDR